MAATAVQWTNFSGESVDTSDWLTGSKRAFRDVRTGEFCTWGSASNFGAGTIDLWVLQTPTSTPVRVATGAPNAIAPYPDLLMDIDQSSDGFVHAIFGYNNLSFLQYYYVRYRLTYGGGHVTGYLVDQQPIALPLNSIDDVFDMRAVIIIGRHNGAECPFWGFQAAAGGDTSYVHYAGRITGTSGQTDTVGLDGTGQSTLMYSRAVTANTRNHNIQFLIAQNLTTEDFYGLTAPFDSDYFLQVAQNTEWDVLGIRWVRSGGAWAYSATAQIFTVPPGGSDQPQICHACSVAGKACLMYYLPGTGLVIGYFDDSGTWHTWVTVSSTTAQAYFGSFWVSSNGKRIFAAWNRYNANGTTSNGGFGYYDVDAAAWTTIADSDPQNTEMYSGSAGWDNGLIAVRGTPGDTLGQTRTGNQVAIIYLPQPTITQQPSNQSAAVGGTATFTIAATASSGSNSYQPQRFVSGSWTNVGTNSTTYTTGTLSGADDGAQFRFLITDSNDTITSSVATLQVLGIGTRVKAGGGVGAFGAGAFGGQGIESTAVILAAVSEAGSASDSASLVLTANRTLSEAGSVLDVLSSALSALQSIDETMNGSDALSSAANFTSSLSEVASVADTNSSTMSVSVAMAEVVAATDLISTIMVSVAAITEAVTTLDALAGALFSSAVNSESLTSSDVQTANNSSTALVAESISVADAIALSYDISQLINELVSASDFFATGNVYSSSITETASLSESLVGITDVIKAIAETISSSDQLFVLTQMQAALSGIGSAIDVLQATGAATVAVFDSVNASDIVRIITNTLDIYGTRVLVVQYKSRVISVRYQTRFLVNPTQH